MHGFHARLHRLLEHFWLLPACAIALAVLCGLAFPALDDSVTLPDAVALSGQEDTARAVLAAIATLGVSIAGVAFSVIVVALVLASQQLSPRVLRSFQRQRLNQAVLAMLLGTATYSLFVLGQISKEADRPVPEASVTLAMALTAGALGLFVVFVHHAVRSLNASTVIRRIAADGHEALSAPYPAGAGQEPDDEATAERAVESRWHDARSVEVRSPRAGYVASVDGAVLVAWAQRNDAFVEQLRGVGDFAITDAPLARVRFGGDEREAADVASAFHIEEERVVEGDIAFPVRQLADIALKGLSPGINDPTTSENAMDSLTDTLVRFARGRRPSQLRLDGDGVPRLRARAPSLDGLVRLGFDQVRRDAAGRPSFAVRLLELLADLRHAVPADLGCVEMDRQARLIAEHAEAQAEHDADQEMVADAYRRLHGGERVATAR